MKVQFTALAILFSVTTTLSQVSQSFASTTNTVLQGNVGREVMTAPANSGSLVTLKTKTGSFKHLQNADFELDESNNLQLGTGEVLISCRLPTRLSLGDYSLDIGANTVAMVTNENGIVVVRNLKEHDENSVTLIDHSTNRAYIRAGQEFIIGASSDFVDELSNRQAMGLKLQVLVGTKKVIYKMTSLVALNGSPLLSTVSGRKEKDEQAVSKTVTTQIAQLDKSETNYSLHTH